MGEVCLEVRSLRSQAVLKICFGVVLLSGYALAQSWSCGSGACTTSGNVSIGPSANGGSPSLTAAGALGQTANIFQVTDNSGNVLLNVDPNGNAMLSSPQAHSFFGVGSGGPYINAFIDGPSGNAGFGNNLYYNGTSWVFANTAGYGGQGTAWFMRPGIGVQLMFAVNGVNPATPYTVFSALQNGNIGIGTTSPQFSLDVYGTGAHVLQTNANGSYPLQIQNQMAKAASGNYVGLLMNTDDGQNSVASSLVFFGDPTPSHRYLRLGAYDQQTYTWQNISLQGNVGIGTTNPQHPLQVSGTIGAEEVIVSSTGADYVFDRGYKLAPLSEVASYIHANHHLPEIPSAEEVEEKGIGLGEMQAKLLAKIEELTLHLIEVDKRVGQLEQENRELKAQQGNGVVVR